MPRLALFDLDDTLIGSRAAFVGWAGRQVELHGADRAAGGVEAFLRVEHIHWTRDPEDTFRGFAEFFSLSTSPVDLMRSYRAEMAETLVCFPGVFEGLEALRDSGWRIGIVTNGFTDFQNAKIDAVGLRAYVDVVCVSETEGSWKPEAKIFQLAAERAGAPLEGGWMTGDSLGSDIAGAAPLGMHTAWLPRGHRPGTYDVQPEHILEHTADVFPLILGLRRSA
jgi:FMN phosphatase YigB (HAD superfamily)